MQVVLFNMLNFRYLHNAALYSNIYNYIYIWP